MYMCTKKKHNKKHVITHVNTNFRFWLSVDHKLGLKIPDLNEDGSGYHRFSLSCL